MTVLVRDTLYIMEPDSIEHDELPNILHEKKPRKIHFFISQRMSITTIEKFLSIIESYEYDQRLHGNYKTRICIYSLNHKSRKFNSYVNRELKWLRNICDMYFRSYHIETCRCFSSGPFGWGRYPSMGNPTIYIVATPRGNTEIDINYGNGCEMRYGRWGSCK